MKSIFHMAFSLFLANMKSILQSEKKCYITGKTNGLHCHHIYYGNANRAQSEKYGFTVWLIGELHNLSNYGVHMNSQFDKWLRKKCQLKFEETHSRDEFIQIIGCNYLIDEEIVPTIFNPYLYGSDNENDDWFSDDW